MTSSDNVTDPVPQECQVEVVAEGVGEVVQPATSNDFPTPEAVPCTISALSVTRGFS